MTVANAARRRAWGIVTSRPPEALIRVGFIGYGVLHLAIARLSFRLLTETT